MHFRFILSFGLKHTDEQSFYSEIKNRAQNGNLKVFCFNIYRFRTRTCGGWSPVSAPSRTPHSFTRAEGKARDDYKVAEYMDSLEYYYWKKNAPSREIRSHSLLRNSKSFWKKSFRFLKLCSDLPTLRPSNDTLLIDSSLWLLESY